MKLIQGVRHILMDQLECNPSMQISQYKYLCLFTNLRSFHVNRVTNEIRLLSPRSHDETPCYKQRLVKSGAISSVNSSPEEW